MSMDLLQCPLCDLTEMKATRDASRAIWQVACVTCGEYCITDEAQDLCQSPAVSPNRWRLSAVTRNGSERGEPICIKAATLQILLDKSVDLTISWKAATLLEVIRSGSDFFGNAVRFSAKTDWRMVFANGPEECQFILNHLQEEGLVDQAPRSADRTTPWPTDYCALTWKGWLAVEPIAGGVQGLGFVAMSFRPELERPFEDGILPAIEIDCGLRAIRVDKEHFSENICDRILAFDPAMPA